MARRLQHLFDREIEIVGRTVAACRRFRAQLGAPLRSFLRGGRPRRRRRPQTNGEPTLRVRAWRRGAGAAGLVLSLALHLVGAILFFVLVPRGSGVPTDVPREVVISIRLPIERAPEPERPAVEVPRIPTPPPQPPEPQPPTEVPPPSEPPREIGKLVEAPPAESTESPGHPLAPGPRIDPRVLRPFRDPPPLGVGPAPVPLAGSPGRAFSGALSSRTAQGKIEALRRHGGSGLTEDAVDRGLRWLAAHQDADGGWDAHDFQRHCRHYRACPGQGLREFDVGVSALALLAFLGAGHTPDRDGPHRRNVAKGLQYLLDHQDGAGVFGIPGDKYFYNHALATLALAEGAAMTGDAAMKEGLAAALRHAAAARQPGGGWDYTSEKTGRHDLSITGWQIMALKAAEPVFDPLSIHDREDLRHYLDRAFTEDGYGIYANLDPEAGRRGANMVAVGLLSHLYLGGLPGDTRTRAAVRHLLPRNPPEPASLGRWDLTFQSYYYWYVATLALFHLGGEPWEAWNTLLQEALLQLQSRGGHAEGSWEPEASWIGLSGGRIYATAINVLTLEVYYRYTPLFGARRS